MHNANVVQCPRKIKFAVVYSPARGAENESLRCIPTMSHYYRPCLTDVVTVRLQSAGLQSMLDRWRKMRRLRLLHGFDFVLQEHS